MPVPGVKSTSAVASSRVGGVPAWVSPRASAMEKQVACAAAMSSSGLVTPSGWLARAGHDTGMVPTPDESSVTSPAPSVSVPFHRVLAVRVVVLVTVTVFPDLRGVNMRSVRGDRPRGPVDGHHARMRAVGAGVAGLAIALTVAVGTIAGPGVGVAKAHEGTPGDVRAAVTAALTTMQAAEGTAAALAELERQSRSDGDVAGVCHAIAHELGHQALAAADGRLATALAERSDVCGGGYVHGVVEAALGTSRHPARDLLGTCAPDDGSCWHGVGHGLMFALRMDPDRSVALCAKAPSAAMERRCGEGVFMQLFNAESSSATAVPTLRETSQQCARTQQPQVANCWFYAPNAYLARHPDGFAGAMRWCASRSGTVAQQVCARGVGSRTVKRHPDDLSVGARTCARAGRLQASCLAGMASYWSVHWQGTRTPASLCAALPSLRRPCRAAVHG